MIVCHCKAVSDRKIREAVQRGACTPRQVVMACSAGKSCGGCMPVVRALIESAREGAERLEEIPAAAAG